MKSQQKIESKEAKIAERYIEASGGRKTASARARLYTKGSGLTVNGSDYKDYFRAEKHRAAAIAPFELMKVGETMRASVKVVGGGINAQAEAVRNAIAKALAKFNQDFKKRLRRAGFITRDSRAVERKKYGLKKARRAPQWQKR